MSLGLRKILNDKRQKQLAVHKKYLKYQTQGEVMQSNVVGTSSSSGTHSPRSLNNNHLNGVKVPNLPALKNKTTAGFGKKSSRAEHQYPMH